MPLDQVPLAGWEAVVLGASALLICVLATALAVESATLFVPAFLIVYPTVLPRFPALTVNEAIGLTLVVMLFGQTSANVGYWLRGQIDVAIAGRVLLWTVPLAVVGRASSYLLPDEGLLLVFAALLVTLAAVVARHLVSRDREPAPEGPERATDGGRDDDVGLEPSGRPRLVMGSGGLVTGLVGVGIGEVCNTYLAARNDLSVHRSIGTSTLVLYLTVLAATVTNLALISSGAPIGSRPSIPWTLAAVIAPAVLIGGQVGPHLNSNLPAHTIVRLLVVLYLAVAVVTVVRVMG